MSHILRDLSILALITVAAVSDLLGQATAQRRIDGGRFEASGVVHVPGTDGVLFVDDGQTRKIFWMRLSGDGVQKSAAVEVPLPGADVVDLEGITTDGKYFYAVGSQSKKTGLDGDGLIRFTFDPATRQIAKVESVRGLKRFLAQNVTDLKGADQRIGDEVLNIEGLAWDPKETRLLLALRAPVSGNDALIVPVSLRDSAGPFAAENLVVDGNRAIRLATGGAGLRSLEFDAQRDRFIVITGAVLDPEVSDFRVLAWDGRNGAAPEEIRSYSRKLKPEGVTRARFAERDATVIVFDTGSYEVHSE
jgi:hypothetical protein